ncbi:hypothetical protein ACE1TF_05115 [Geomicrobium sp. JSM 1781026]|uniref:hypothetical protein n=1 Tax=Geomicrobium sp. JSM 1781026 TaxID=3344580 RepID=UPI0035BF0C6B
MNNILKPHVIVFVTVMSSFILWWLPIDTRKGFLIEEDLAAKSILLVLFWYTSVIFFAYIGYSFGKKIKPIEMLNKSSLIVNNYFYRFISILSIIGILFTYVTVIVNNPNFIFDILDANANQLKYTLYDNYSQGLHSLRYLTIVSGALAILKLIKRQQSILDWINIVAVLMTALVSSRLAIVMLMVLLFCSLIQQRIKVKRGILITLGILMFFALTIFNYTRNANFYRDHYNIENPILMNLAEIMTYLGTPFQATLGVLNNIEHFNRTTTLTELISFIIPETFHGLLGIEVNFISTYRYFVNLEDALTTNSSLVLLVDSIGFYSFFIIIFTVIVYSVIIGHFSNYSNALVLISYIFLYCMFELWRTFLFNQGIVHTLAIGTILSYICALIIYLMTRSRSLKEG